MRPERVGPYRLGERLGRGGMGEVFSGWDERLERPVALKRVHAAMSSTVRKRFQREAQVVARLSHPSIVTLHDVVETETDDWLVLELIDGPTLKTVLLRGPVPKILAAYITSEIAGALAEAHRAEIVHRDLKPENVLLDRRGIVKVLDFGLARVLTEESLTATGAILGTPRAMSPEQAMGLDIDHRSDFFSLGSLFYEMLTGVSPFRRKDPIETISAIVSAPCPPILELYPGLSPQLVRIVEWLLQKDPAQRPQRAVALQAALQEELHGKRQQIADAMRKVVERDA